MVSQIPAGQEETDGFEAHPGASIYEPITWRRNFISVCMILLLRVVYSKRYKGILIFGTYCRQEIFAVK
ncbi:MAG TPA: hypothetical protein VF346_10850 [Bacteroidales bacterium]